MVWIPQQSFPFGEVDPSILASPQQPPFRGGARIFQNGILTRFGSAKRRYGTTVVEEIASNRETALFPYSAGGDQFIVSITASNAVVTERVIRVYDVATRSLVSWATPLPTNDGPFPLLASSTAENHHFLEGELDEIRAIQHGERLYLIHPNHPPLFLERRIFANGEFWLYDVSPVSNVPPKVQDGANGILITLSGVTLTADRPVFTVDDTDTLWVIGRSTTTTKGLWLLGNTPVPSATKFNGQLAGTPDPDVTNQDASDWTGPYKDIVDQFGVPITATLTNTGLLTTIDNEERVFSVTAGVSPTGQLGNPIRIAGTSWLITNVISSTQFTGTRIGNSGGALAAGATGLAAQYLFVLNRAHVSQRPIYPKRAVNGGGLNVVRVFQPDTTGEFLPPNHDALFDRIKTQNQFVPFGGAIFLNGGLLAVISKDTDVNNGFFYECIELKPLRHLGPSLQWSLGWSKAVGFPTAGTSHQSRLWFGGFAGAGSRVVASRVGDSESWDLGALADDPISLEINDPDGGAVTWMTSTQDLLIGTERSEYKLAGAPITAGNFGIDRQSGYGGSSVQPLIAANNAIFIDASRRGVREMSFVFERDRYQSPDLTDAAAHLFASQEVVQLGLMVNPDQVVVARTKTGVLLAMSYRRENGVVGWSPWVQPSFPINTNTGSKLSTVQSIASVRAAGARQADELWIVRSWVKGGRSGAGDGTRTIEVMSPDYTLDLEATVGAGGVISTTGQTNDPVDGFVQLSDQSVGMFNDGVDIGTFIVSTTGDVTWGSIGYTVAPTVVKGGMRFVFHLAPVIQELVISGLGATQGQRKNISTVLLYLVNSRGGAVDGKQIGDQVVPQPQVIDPVDPIDGWYAVYGTGEYGTGALIDIIQSDAYPFEVGGLNLDVDFGSGT